MVKGGFARTETQIAALILDRCRFGAIVTDRLGTLLFGNHAAREMLQRGDALFLERGTTRLACHRREECDALRAALVEPGDGSQLVRLTGFGKEGYVLTIAQLSFYAREHRLITITSLSPARYDACRVFRIFGLTPREAALAGLLFEGQSLREAACSLEVGVSTAKTHLKSIFVKTHTSRQSELTRLIASVIPPLLADSDSNEDYSEDARAVS